MATKAKKRKEVTEAKAYVQARFNNTIVTITDDQGDPLCWASAGTCGLKGSRKGTPHAGTLVAEKATTLAKEFNIKVITIIVKGPGQGRDTAARVLIGCPDWKAKLARDDTGIAHNGCRQRKRRRV
ncbi:MAG: 30S ribosomal protein S11 [Gammaproteobacteria bacterium]